MYVKYHENKMHEKTKDEYIKNVGFHVIYGI